MSSKRSIRSMKPASVISGARGLTNFLYAAHWATTSTLKTVNTKTVRRRKNFWNDISGPLSGLQLALNCQKRLNTLVSGAGWGKFCCRSATRVTALRQRFRHFPPHPATSRHSGGMGDFCQIQRFQMTTPQFEMVSISVLQYLHEIPDCGFFLDCFAFCPRTNR